MLLLFVMHHSADNDGDLPGTASQSLYGSAQLATAAHVAERDNRYLLLIETKCHLTPAGVGASWFAFGVPAMGTKERSVQRGSATEDYEHSEGTVAKTIEEQTAKIPSDVFLWAAGASMAASLILKLNDRPHDALFVGQWAAPFLIMGLYNKLVKVAGSDRLAA